MPQNFRSRKDGSHYPINKRKTTTSLQHKTVHLISNKNYKNLSEETKLKSAFVGINIRTPQNLPLKNCIEAELHFERDYGDDKNVDKANYKLIKIFGKRLEDIDWRDPNTVEVSFKTAKRIKSTIPTQKKNIAPKTKFTIKRLVGHTKNYDIYESKSGKLYEYYGTKKEHWDDARYWRHLSKD